MSRQRAARHALRRLLHFDMHAIHHAIDEPCREKADEAGAEIKQPRKSDQRASPVKSATNNPRGLSSEIASGFAAMSFSFIGVCTKPGQIEAEVTPRSSRLPRSESA